MGVANGASLVGRLRRGLDHFSPSDRIISGLALLSMSGYLFFNGRSVAILLSFLGLAAITDALRNGSVWSAFAAFRGGDLDLVDREIRKISWPRLLCPTAAAYYHWLRGIIDLSSERFAAARVHLLVAACGSLRTEDDRALVHGLLAEISARSGDMETVREHLEIAARLAGDRKCAGLIKGMKRRLLPD